MTSNKYILCKDLLLKDCMSTWHALPTMHSLIYAGWEYFVGECQFISVVCVYTHRAVRGHAGSDSQLFIQEAETEILLTKFYQRWLRCLWNNYVWHILLICTMALIVKV